MFFFWRVLTYRQPIVDLRAFGNRNFALGSFYTFRDRHRHVRHDLSGAALSGAGARLQRLQIGETVFVAGLAHVADVAVRTQIARRLDLRLMLAIGFVAVRRFDVPDRAGLTNQTGFWELFVPQALRGIALMFCYLPINMIALGTLPPDKLKNAAGLYNLTRDLGGALGLATIGTVMNERLHFHWNRLIEDINPARPVVQQFLDAQTSRLEPLISGDPAQAAIKLLAGLVQREALVLTYSDALMMIGAVFVVGVILMPLARPPRTMFSR